MSEAQRRAHNRRETARYHRMKEENPDGLREQQRQAYRKRMADPVKAERAKEYARQKMREYRASNPKKARASYKKQHRALMSDPERLERKRAYAREYQRNLRGAFREERDGRKSSSERQAEYIKRNPRRWLSNKLKSKYGITLSDYEELLTKQNGVCAICGKAEISTYKGKPRKLAVDHCHETNHVRGLLCCNCNTGIGSFLHQPSLLAKAAAYLAVNA